MLFSEGRASHLRELSADVVSRLVKIPGIVVSASGIKAKATRISIQCRSCRTVVPNIDIRPGPCWIFRNRKYACSYQTSHDVKI